MHATTLSVTPPAGPATTPASFLASPAQRRRVGLSTIAAAVFVAATLAFLVGVGGRLASIGYVAVALATGAIFYFRDPAGYVSFSLWLWLITPFVRRVIDMHHGWTPASPALLAPLVVAALSLFTILRRVRDLRGVLYAPYLLVVLALGYGYSVGLITAGPVPATYALLTWLAPASFGLHVALSWRQYPALAASIRRSFAWALPVLAAYGIYQFVRMPVWDASWMTNSDLRSIGEPLPFLARTFGMLNTPGPFGAFMCAGILMVLAGHGRFRFVSIGLGAVALLLSRTRAVWVAFVIGLFVQQLGQPARRLPRYVGVLIAAAIISVPIVSIPQFSNLIVPRLLTFTNLAQDNSFVKRYNFSEQAALQIMATAEGNGLGSTGGATKLRGGQGIVSLDNGFLEVFFIFGWPGGSLLFLGIAGLGLQATRFREAKADPFANAARATFVALLSILPIGDVFTGSTGTLLWMSVGFGIAAHAYHLTTGQALRSQAWRRRPASPPWASGGVAVPVPVAAGTERAVRA